MTLPPPTSTKSAWLVLSAPAVLHRPHARRDEPHHPRRARRARRGAGRGAADDRQREGHRRAPGARRAAGLRRDRGGGGRGARSEEHTSELQSRSDLVCRLLLEKKKKISSNRFS